MRLKLDLHPIFNDSFKIEQALHDIVSEALRIRASEIEIIPGKGSGALKKTVLRFFDRPEVKASIHRVEKDSDNWGRLYVHFRHERPVQAPASPKPPAVRVACECACCGVSNGVEEPDGSLAEVRFECAGCGSPNRARLKSRSGGRWRVETELAYE